MSAPLESKEKAFNPRLTLTQWLSLCGVLLGGLGSYVGYTGHGLKATADSPEAAAQERRLSELETQMARHLDQFEKEKEMRDWMRTQIERQQGRIRELEHKAGYDASGDYYQQRR